jgi:hypothetical protein
MAANQSALNPAMWSAQDLKRAADQGIAFAQHNYGFCVQNGKRSEDFE